MAAQLSRCVAIDSHRAERRGILLHVRDGDSRRAAPVRESKNDRASWLLAADVAIRGGGYASGIFQPGVRHHETNRISQQMRAGSLLGTLEQLIEQALEVSAAVRIPRAAVRRNVHCLHNLSASPV